MQTSPIPPRLMNDKTWYDPIVSPARSSTFSSANNDAAATKAG
jgi:hypothetical protein